MKNTTDWVAIAGNGHCIPMPTTTTDISDMFGMIHMGAPAFTALQKAATYP